MSSSTSRADAVTDTGSPTPEPDSAIDGDAIDQPTAAAGTDDGNKATGSDTSTDTTDDGTTDAANQTDIPTPEPSPNDAPSITNPTA